MVLMVNKAISIFSFPENILSYRKFPEYSDTEKICCNHSIILPVWLYHRVMSPNDADGMANSADPDLGAV